MFIGTLGLIMAEAGRRIWLKEWYSFH
jgi:hypothetical protein